MQRQTFVSAASDVAPPRDADRGTPMSDPAPAAAPTVVSPPVVVKKYANRRLYNTESSSYITLDTLADMVRHGRDFIVYDAKSGDDITRSVLTQIIVEEEGKGPAMLPTAFLRQLIGFYGDNLQNLVPRYLENAMAAFARQQESIRRTMEKTVGTFFPFEEVSRQNMAMMERAMNLFTPFYRPNDKDAEPESPEMQALRHEVEALRAEVVHLRSLPPPPPTLQLAPPPTPPEPSADAAAEHPAETGTSTAA
jgi:polyhydroxyalkanoate synthesis repressor PhaR